MAQIVGGTGEEFEGSSSWLADMERQQASLRQQAEAGEISLEPGAANHAAKLCRDYKDRLGGRLRELERLHAGSGFGDCIAGNGLAAHFEYKRQELRSVLLQAQEVMENMALTFEATGRAYQEADEANKNYFQDSR